MLNRVVDFIRQHKLLRPRDRVLVAVSGGPDSVCLLHLLHSLAPRLELQLRVAHLDHGMRDASGADLEFTRAFCTRLNLPLTIAQVSVPAEAHRRRKGLEETGRELRREFLRRTAAEHGCRVVALGHHRGDQAETVLHRLLRGSGASGLAGMRPQSGIFIRPLLAVSRDAILAYLKKHGLDWVEDSSNHDLHFCRNRIRHQVIPLLRQFNPRVEEALFDLSRRLGGEEEFWRVEVEKALEGATRQELTGELRLDRSRLLILHPALRLRVLRTAYARVRGCLTGLAGRHLDALEHLLVANRPQAEAHLPGLWAARRYSELWLRSSPPELPADFACQVDGPATIFLPENGRLQITLDPQAAGETREAVEFAAGAAPFPLCIRRPRPGDRFRPSGGAGGRKLKDFFIDGKIEREKRLRTLLVESGEILWLVGMRRCEGGRPVDGERVLRLLFMPGEADISIVKSEGL